ncbi:MAG: hypothetical protein OEV44_13175 [Spirochaetota bacterium]|nr:hypothetical protein [Spirochaetota bacterium]
MLRSFFVLEEIDLVCVAFLLGMKLHLGKMKIDEDCNDLRNQFTAELILL